MGKITKLHTAIKKQFSLYHRIAVDAKNHKKAQLANAKLSARQLCVFEGP